MREIVFEYIEVDYDRKSLHSYLDCRCPDVLKQQKWLNTVSNINELNQIISH